MTPILGCIGPVGHRYAKKRGNTMIASPDVPGMVEPLAEKTRKASEVAATKVDFFTLVRGEN